MSISPKEGLEFYKVDYFVLVRMLNHWRVMKFIKESNFQFFHVDKFANFDWKTLEINEEGKGGGCNMEAIRILWNFSKSSRMRGFAGNVKLHSEFQEYKVFHEKKLLIE